MEITKKQDGETLEITLVGQIDSETAPQFEKELLADLEGLKSLVLDFAELEYISSAGLRVLLRAQKVMNSQGQMIVKNVNPGIMEVFEITGFAHILTIE